MPQTWPLESRGMASGETRGPNQPDEIQFGDLGFERESRQHECGRAGQGPAESGVMTQKEKEPRDREKLSPSDTIRISGLSQA